MSDRQRRSRTRRALKQALAVLAFFVVLEGVLALCGVQPLAAAEDPYAGFAGSLPLFVEERAADGTATMVTAPGKLELFNAQSFPAIKPPGTTRIVSLGGSTVYGHPYDDRVSFSGFLREMLPAVDGSRAWEVINCGGISYASYRELLVLEELLRYQPDVVIVYSGPNEFLEQRTYGDLGSAPPALLRFGALLSRTRTFAAARRLVRALRVLPADGAAGEAAGGAAADPSDGAGARGGTRLPAEVRTRLDDAAGLSRYTRDDALRDDVLAHFRFNLGRMADRARAAGARILFVTPASELRDCAPFKREHGPGLSAADAAAVDALLARAAALGQPAGGQAPGPEALALLSQAVALDPRDALAQDRLGEALFAARRFDEARAALERARDEDVCPLRPLTAMRGIVLDAAREHGADALDFVAVLDEQCERTLGHRVPGHEQFLDHVHLNVAGYRLLAQSLLEKLETMGVVHDSDGQASAGRAAALAAACERVEARLDPEQQGFALRNLAKTLGWAGKEDEARRLAQQTLAVLGDGDSESHFLLGNFAAHAGRNDEAVAEYRRAVAIDGAYVEAWLNLADTLLRAGRPDEALAALDRVAALQPDNAQALSIRGLLLDAQGRRDEALAALSRAHDLAPGDAQIGNNYGLVLAHAGQLDPAIEVLQRAVMADPGHAKAHYNLALLLARRNRIEDAVSHLQQALSLDPGYAEAREHLDALRPPGGAPP